METDIAVFKTGQSIENSKRQNVKMSLVENIFQTRLWTGFLPLTAVTF